MILSRCLDIDDLAFIYFELGFLVILGFTAVVRESGSLMLDKFWNLISQIEVVLISYVVRCI